MTTDLQDLRNQIEQRKGRKAQILLTIDELENRLRQLHRSLRQHEEAREIIHVVGLKTQQRLQYHISDVASMALEAVYDDPYQLSVEFAQQRNRTECNILFVKNDEKIDPMEEAGGGTVDVASFSLRVASWSMKKPRFNNVLVLDEPFKNVSADLLPRASDMLRQVSMKLNLQIIMATHSDPLVEVADRVFLVEKHKDITEVKQQ